METGTPPQGREVAVLERLLERGGPFTAQEAVAEGATYAWLRRWCQGALLRHPVRGVYHPPSLVDDLALRVAVLRLVVPHDCVVTDRTAGWLWGARMILAPGDHLATPPVHVFGPPGRRLRNGLVDSGERMLQPDDVAVLEGLRVTTPLRTACDLGRLLHRDQAMAALDSLTALGAFDAARLSREVIRFRGYRGVIQLRTLAPYVDPLAESPGESILRLRWIDAGIPRPRCQVPIPAPDGGSFFLDLGLPEARFGAEYDGAEWHGEAEREHDDARRTWARDEHGWTIVVARRDNVHGRDQDIERVLRRTWDERRK